MREIPKSAFQNCAKAAAVMFWWERPWVVSPIITVEGEAVKRPTVGARQ